MVTDTDMFEAYRQCMRHKAGSAGAMGYLPGHRRDLLRLADEINARTYRPSTSTAFIVTSPRYREVFAADFRDRVAHHYLAMRIEPLLEAAFSDRTFNCRKGKGVLYGIDMLKSDIRECSGGYTRDCWAMRLDLRGFFMSIDKELLDGRLSRFIGERYEGDDKEEVLWLAHVTVMHSPELDCILRSPAAMWEHLPANKSLFTNGDGLGLPYHGRYVDDFYVVDTDKERMLAAVPAMRRMLADELHLELHPDKFYIQHYSKGIRFTGAVVKFGRVYPARRLAGNFQSAVWRLNRAGTVEGIRRCVQSINSYLGLLRHMDSYALRRRVLGMIDSRLFEYLYIRGHHEVLCMKKRYTRVRIPWRECEGCRVYYAKDLNDHEIIIEDETGRTI